MPGYWEPHSSSVDFCEPNYFLSSYVTEPHNVWSSLFITYIATIGMLYGNPSKEWCIFTMYAVLASVGIGSACLHTTLHWLPQSSDEVPMLWQVLSLVHMIWLQRTYSKGKKESNAVGFAFLAIAVVQTILYYCFQQIYAVFIASMIIYSAFIIVWMHVFISATPKPDRKELRWFIHMRAFLLIVVGFGLWIIDMSLCDSIMPFYKSISGFTLHVFWHAFAGLSTCYTAANLTTIRMQELKGLDVELRFVHGFIPVCCMIKGSNKKSS